ncbi:MAG: alpha-D-ribose 1-methylphosphonate 5-triphosphate diphosphatase [Halobacteriales archaeon]
MPDHSTDRAEQTQSVTLTNARIVGPQSVFDGYLRLSNGQIDACERGHPSSQAGHRLDVGQNLVVPGLVDLHGDDIEDQRCPRGDRRVDDRFALSVCDRANLAAGVTTKFHAVAFEDSPGENRSVGGATELVESIRSATGLLADHRVNARCELTDPTSVSAVGAAVEETDVDIVTVQSALPGTGQFDRRAALVRWYDEHDGNARLDRDPVAAADSLFEDCATEDLRERLDSVCAAAESSGVPVGSHDAESQTEVNGLADRGIDFLEYPVTMEAAREARETDVAVVMGAPNYVHGGSLFDNLGAREVARADVLDALCADYSPPALCRSVAVGTDDSLVRRVNRVTAAPAEIAGLDDRGTLVPGARADVAVLDTDPVPTVSRVFVAGQERYRAGT